MSKTALVTGGAGFIGSHLVDLLIEKKFKVMEIKQTFINILKKKKLLF